MGEKNFETALAKINNTYFPLIERQLTGHGIKMDEYSRKCVLNAISAINNALETAGVQWKDPQLDQSNITQILLNVAALKLNAAANPREVFFQVRNVKVKKNGEETWKKVIEMGVEGDGNDAILANFGRGVKEVRQFWLVREGDEFEYPEYNGLEMKPPRWKPSGKGKVVRVVYPIIKTSGIVEYYIAEREDVLKNLLAHINNNLMNETFGLAESRHKATAKQREQIAQKKKALIEKAEKLGLDKALDDPELQQYISPAWKEPHSRESMIIRKMRNNIVKKIPKDFGHALIELSYEEVSNEEERAIQEEIRENANREVIDIDFEEEPDRQEPENSHRKAEEGHEKEEPIEKQGQEKETPRKAEKRENQAVEKEPENPETNKEEKTEDYQEEFDFDDVDIDDEDVPF